MAAAPSAPQRPRPPRAARPPRPPRIRSRPVRRAPLWVPALLVVLAGWLAWLAIDGAREVVRDQEGGGPAEVALVPLRMDAPIGAGWSARVEDVLAGRGATGFVLAEAPDSQPLPPGFVHVLVLVEVVPGPGAEAGGPLSARVTDALNRPLGRPCPATPTPLPPALPALPAGGQEVRGNICAIVPAEEAIGLRVALVAGDVEAEPVRFATQPERAPRS